MTENHILLPYVALTMFGISCLKFNERYCFSDRIHTLSLNGSFTFLMVPPHAAIIGDLIIISGFPFLDSVI